nr:MULTISPECIES: PAS domain-containing protein [unclassified Rhizobium]
MVNNAAIDLYGYSRQDYERMTVLDIRPERECKRMLEAVQAPTDMECAERWTHLKANGETLEVLTYGRAVRFDGRDAILAIVQDRTEVNAAQRQVNDTRSMLDNLPVGVFVKDMEEDGRYILFNEACGVIAGHDPEDIIGQSDRIIFDEKQMAIFCEQDSRALAREQRSALKRQCSAPMGRREFCGLSGVHCRPLTAERRATCSAFPRT